MFPPLAQKINLQNHPLLALLVDIMRRYRLNRLVHDANCRVRNLGCRPS